MFFITRQITARLNLTTPPTCCCNCGAEGELEYVDTPLRQSRFYFVYGTELTLDESFPYCPRCVRTAARVRFGLVGRFLMLCLFTSVVATVGAVFADADALPKFIAEHFLIIAAILGAALFLTYYYLLDWGRHGRTYFQPVSLVAARTRTPAQFQLRFYNARYAKVAEQANQELVRAGTLKIES